MSACVTSDVIPTTAVQVEVHDAFVVFGPRVVFQHLSKRTQAQRNEGINSTCYCDTAHGWHLDGTEHMPKAGGQNEAGIE